MSRVISAPNGQASARTRTAAPIPDRELREQYRLTPREVTVARLLAHRRTTAEIGAVLRISRHTVRRHVESVLAKLGVNSRFAVEAKLRVDR